MNDRLGIRLTSLALSIVVTFALFAGIETLAEGLHAGAPQIAQSVSTSRA
ncbi:MAG: hypothetical protein ABIQ29_03165 [Burkholderiaceae bacterium]